LNEEIKGMKAIKEIKDGDSLSLISFIPLIVFPSYKK